jgi:enediyne biosynthesis protein E4
MKKLYIFTLFILINLVVSNGQTPFTRISDAVFTQTLGDWRSVNWIDYNNDGWLDLFISQGPRGGANNKLYKNNKNGTFTAIANDPIVSDNAPSDGATWGDMDNDGDIDCFVVNWYGISNLFYLNNGNGSFTQTTTGNFVTDGGYSETASWGDYDNDGFLDLYVANSEGNKRNFLYHNEKNGTFSKITSGSPVTDAFLSRSVNWTDYDNDGDLDLFVTNEENQNDNLYRNDGGGVFTKITNVPIVLDGGSTMSSSWITTAI